MTILQPFFFFFWTAELIFLGRLVIENPIFFFFKKKKISGAIIFNFFWLKPIPVTVMATFGWCSTEKPALFTCPSHVWDRSFGFGPFF